MKSIVLILALLQHCLRADDSAVASSPNIIFIFFDDLGLADVSFNGGIASTPVLDALVSDNAIKLNFHYTEPLCSPTRSSLYTGRYAWKSGLNTIVSAGEHSHVSRDLVFYPQLLQSNAYNTFITGKWHVGYKYAEILPVNRGFSEGVYQRQSTQYRTRSSTQALEPGQGRRAASTLFDSYPTQNESIKERLIELFPGGLLPHDLWSIEDGEDVPVLVGDTTSYVEDIYTERILQFMDRQNGSTPFYIQYNLWTPHIALTEPPELSDTFRFEYDSVCNLNETGKDLFCRAMLYAQQKIEEIVNKTKEIGVWDNTLILISSDNGPRPGSNSYGQTLPLRSIKQGILDGAIRTPAFLIGGYTEQMLSGLTTPTTLCEYNRMVHASDWFNIFTDIAGISHDFADEDHQQDIWSDIQCQCDISCVGSADDTAVRRDELISLHKCEGGSLYASMMIKDGWKLAINASADAALPCPWSPNLNYLYWSQFDAETYTYPGSDFYEEYYERQMNLSVDRAELLYVSECLEDLYANASAYTNVGIDNASNPLFSRSTLTPNMMLFELENDRIEACNLADFMPTKVEQMASLIMNRSELANGTTRGAKSVGAMFAMIDSFDCDSDSLFLMPWGGANEDMCGDLELDDVEGRECAPLWQTLIDRKEACDPETTVVTGSASDSEDDNNSSAVRAMFVYAIVCAFVVVFWV